MRAQAMVIGLLQAALLMACERPERISDETGKRDAPYNKASNAVALGAVGKSTVSQQEASAAAPQTDQWFPPWHSILPPGSSSVPVRRASRLIRSSLQWPSCGGLCSESEGSWQTPRYRAVGTSSARQRWS